MFIFKVSMLSLLYTCKNHSMKAFIKTLKKIGLAYTLQIFAVIILFGYALSSSGNGMKETDNNKDMMPPIGINQQLIIKPSSDSLLAGKINIWSMYLGKGW